MQASQPDYPLPFIRRHLYRIDFESDLLNLATDCTPVHTLVPHTGVPIPALLRRRRMSNSGHRPHREHFTMDRYLADPNIGHTDPLNPDQSNDQSWQRTGPNIQPPHPAGTHRHSLSDNSGAHSIPPGEHIPGRPTRSQRGNLGVSHVPGFQTSFQTRPTSSGAQPTVAHYSYGQRVSDALPLRQSSAAGQAIQRTATMNSGPRSFAMANGVNAHSGSVNGYLRRPQDPWSSLGTRNQPPYTFDTVEQGQYEQPYQTHGNNRSAASAYRPPLTPISRDFGHGRRTQTAREELPSGDQSVPDSDTLLTSNSTLLFSNLHSPNTSVAGPQLMLDEWGNPIFGHASEMLPRLPRRPVEGTDGPDVPRNPGRERRRASAISSAASIPSVGPETTSCSCHICGTRFHGQYSRGNLSRHKRLKHGNMGQGYPCEVAGCRKTYRRQDARLKHYRNKHPELDVEDPRRRK